MHVPARDRCPAADVRRRRDEARSAVVRAVPLYAAHVVRVLRGQVVCFEAGAVPPRGMAGGKSSVPDL